MDNRHEAHRKIANLVTRFNEQKEFYKHQDYNETQTRRDFIDPFWKALGWDIDNENGYAESYREVIHEDKIKIGKATKAPDYSFRLVGGKRLFFLEAKKPSVYVKDAILPAYQVRRYGWSAKMPISIISDFEEFAVYDCTTKPKPTDKASHGRIKYLNYEQYLTEFDFIWETFGKEKVLKGSFDKYIQTDRNKKGTSTVDQEFLISLDTWRKELALNIALRNKNLNEEELNFVVQNIIDRIIFLRIAEDRSVERYGELQSAVNTGNFYQNLLQRFQMADQKYNSGLFDFQKDKISDHLSIDNKIIKTIVSELYYPKSPYEFSVLSVEILGNAYEQFLGKQISLSKSGRAVIEEKPEVRKAGGVYYTPQYIVDYIVENTIGKILQNKTPTEANKIKIIDPACGSGSFLLGAYQYLLNWHKDFYTENGKKSKGEKNNPLTPMGELTSTEKKRILLNNIYGVDLDSNAVEVTKLSLLLKCMEGETQATIESQSKLFHDRILPTLDDNIKCGNSLIGLDYYESELDFGEERKIKPFSWEKAFPQIFEQGGFDCVIGNPPWITMRGKENMDVAEKEIHYYQKEYPHSAEYKINSYALFIDKGLRLVKPKFYLSYIIPSTILANQYNAKIRKLLLEKYHISKLVNLGKNIFQNVVAESSIFIIGEKQNAKTEVITQVKDLQAKHYLIKSVDQRDFITKEGNEINLDLSPAENNVLIKISDTPFRVKDFLKVYVGIVTGDNKKFITDNKVNSKFEKIITGKDIGRYSIEFKNKYVLFDKTQLHSNTDEAVYRQKEKILIRKTGNILFACLDKKQFFTEQTIYNLYFKGETPYNLNFFVALFNSKLLNFYFNKKLITNADAFPYIKGIHIEALPIPEINFKNKALVGIHDELVDLVEINTSLHSDLTRSKISTRTDQITARISHTDERIDQLVYKLFALNQDEITLLEAFYKA